MVSAKSQRVIVTVEDAHHGKIKTVAKALSAAGLKDVEVLEGVGIIGGAVATTKLAKLTKVKGVAAVEPDGEMKAI